MFCLCKVRSRTEKSEVKDRHIKEVTDAFTLVQVIDVVVVSRRRGEAKQGSKHWEREAHSWLQSSAHPHLAHSCHQTPCHEAAPWPRVSTPR